MIFLRSDEVSHERLWRKDHLKAAVMLTTLTNIGLAAVVAHNYRVAK